MASKRGFSSWRAFSLDEETAYDSAQTPAATDVIELFESEPMEQVITLDDGSVLVGTAAEELESDESQELARASRGTHACRARPNMIACLASYAMGNRSAATNEPSASYYTHTITPNPCTFLDGALDTYTAATIAFVFATKKITDSGNGLAGFATGDTIIVSGSTSNDGTYTVATGGNAGEIVTSEALVEEVAGDTVTIAHKMATVDDTGSFPATGTLIFDEDSEEITYTSKAATQFNFSSGIAADKADNGGVRLKQNTRTMTLPSMTVLDAISGTLYKQWTGVLVNSLTLSGTRKDWVKLSADLVGSGTVTTPGAPTKATALTDEAFLKAGDCTVFWGDGNTMFYSGAAWQATIWDTSNDAEISSSIRSFNWTFNNNLDDTDDYLMGGGVYRERGEVGRRTQTLSMELEMADTTWLTLMSGQTLTDVKIAMTGPSGSYSATLHLPRVYLTGHVIGGGTGIVVTTNEIAIQQHATYGSCMLTVVNQKNGYLHS